MGLDALQHRFIQSAERYDDHAIIKCFRRMPIERTGFVNHVHDGPTERQDRSALTHQLQIVKAQEIIPLLRYFVEQETHTNMRFYNEVMALVRHTNHERRHIVKRVYDSHVTKQYA